ncbi:MAG: single-stranded-DNA-specific exonuclease RecJ, partial [Methylocystis sp.]
MSDSMVPAFLGVERSVLGRRWRGRLDARGEAQALALTQAHGIDDFLARVIAGRGVTVADAAGYLDPKLRDLLPDPSSLRDMDAVTRRLADAIEKFEQIAVFGD